MRPMTCSVTLMIGGTMLPMLAAPPACAQNIERQRYDIQARPLADALRAVAVATQHSIVAPAEILADLRAPTVVGSFTLDEALAALLAGSGLSVHRVGQDIIITRADEAVTSPGPVTDPDLVVTGSRIRGAATASPVISLTKAQIRDAGQSNLGDVVRAIPQSFGGGQNPGVGANVPAASGVNVGSASSINLRGIGSDATLTLLNGHRVAYSASRQSIDVGAIPLGAVERVEIVADGASALYGSDAVAGVANIILKRDYSGLETSARLGTSTDGGDFEQRYGVVAGTRWGTGGLIASYEYANSTAIRGRDRSYASATSPALTLFPPLDTHSAVISVHQNITDTLRFALDTVYNRRRSTTEYANNLQGDIAQGGISNTFDSASLLVAPTLTYAPGRWRLFATGSYGLDRTHFVITSFAGGVATASPVNCYCNSALAAEIGGDGSVIDLPAGALKLAFGAGYRLNDFSRFAGAGSPQNINRRQDSYYGYSELAVPLIAPAQSSPLGKRLDISAAVRFERYPGIGDIATPKFGIIYAPGADITLKGSWGQSFRAPTLFQQYQARSIVLISPALFGGGGFPASSAALYLQGGNPDLRPERATTWSATLDLHPRALPGLDVSFSYFDFAYRDRVVSPIAFIGQSLSNPIYADRLTRAPDAALLNALVAGTSDVSNFTGAPYDPGRVSVLIDNSNVNAGRQSISGVDILLRYRLALSDNRHSLTAVLNTSYLESSQQISSTQPVLPLAGRIFNPPHWRARGGLSWDGGGWGVTGYVNYSGGVEDVRFTPAPDITAMTTLDLSARYKTPSKGVLGNLELSVSVLNLFNARPQMIRTTLLSDAPYDSTNYSPVGRFVALRIARKW